MTNKQFIFTSEVNRKPFVTVYELRDEVPSFEEFMKTYESGTNYDDLENNDISETRGYGPCNCSNSGKCRCNYTKYWGGLVIEGKRTVKIGGKKVGVSGGQHSIHTVNDWAEKKGISRTTKCELWDEEEAVYSFNEKGDFKFMNVASSAGANAGMGGMIASGGAELSVLKLQEGKEFEASVLNGFIGGEIGLGSGGSVAGYSLGIDVINVRQGCFQLNVGIDAGSGMTFGFDGVEVKVGGAGISIGKKMGISTPVGGMSVNLEKVCVVQ